uniref:LRRNT domain-containing protein n=1 Tax=Electrophorus electricus TaxID=8005 RepID=A0A4W4HJI4_ELEEL
MIKDLSALWLLCVLLGAGHETCVWAGCPEGCQCSGESQSVLCAAAGLHEVPRDLPLETVSLHLEHNLIRTLPEEAFQDLLHLQDLHLSHNQIDSLASGALRHLTPDLQFLDLSHNKLRHARREEFGMTRAKTRLYHNPWHCDCPLQELMEGVTLEPETADGIVCESSARGPSEGSRWEEPGAASAYTGQPLVKLLNSGVNFCSTKRRTTDVAMLVTMFVWFIMVTVYVVYYVKHRPEPRAAPPLPAGPQSNLPVGNPPSPIWGR